MSDSRKLMAVDPGDRDVAWIKTALECAIKLEHSTIPPYLCALWSIKAAGHPIRKQILRVVVLEEMGHMALGANMLAALGGVPPIGDPGFVPTYPTPLPCGIRPKHMPDLIVTLEGFSIKLVQDVFMNIEAPDFDPVAIPRGLEPEAVAEPQYPSIGEFYGAIRSAFRALGSAITFPTDKQLSVTFHGSRINKVFPVEDVADALAAIDQIVEQGEGTPTSPEAAMNTPELAHYYQFEQIIENHLFILKDGHWVQSPNPIPPLPPAAIYPMAPIPRGGYKDLPPEVASAMAAFNDGYREMLGNLKQAWVLGGDAGQVALGKAIDRMIGVTGVAGLETLADAIFQFKVGAGPEVYGPNFLV